MSKSYVANELQFNLSKEIQKLRFENNFTIENLAEEMHIPINNLYSLELGNYKDWPMIFKFAKFFKKRIK